MLIRKTRTIRKLASPVRLAILDALEALGPSSAADIAEVVGLRPDGVYYHLRLLEQESLVKSSASKRKDRAAAIFKVPAGTLRLAYASEKRTAAALDTVVAAMLRSSLRMFRKGLTGGARFSGRRRELWAAQRVARLTPSQLERINELLSEVLDLLAEGRGAKEGKLYALTFVLAPFGRVEGRARRANETRKASKEKGRL